MFKKILGTILSKKIIYILCIAIVFLLIFSSCSQANEESKTPINDDKVKFIELEEKSPPDIANFEWTVVDEEEYIERSDLIFKGTIMNKKEYLIEEKVSYKFTAKYYKTVYSIKITDIYYSDDKGVKIGDTIKVMSPVTSYNWEQKAVQMENGQEFILFTGLVKDMETANGIVKLTDLAKYFIGNPWEPIISVKEDTFEMDEVFNSLAKDSTIKEQKIYDGYTKKVMVRKNKDFINELKNLISKYKNK